MESKNKSNIVLITEYHVPKDPQRHREYLHCLKQNITNQHIKKIELFVESDTKARFSGPFSSAKLNYNIKPSRPTFQDLFNFCNRSYPDQICMIANADITFDDTLGDINCDNIQGKFLALSRWEDPPDAQRPYRIRPFGGKGGWSHDTWIFKTPVEIKHADFPMGKCGCDHAIAYLAHESGMLVTNPCWQIITHHKHRTGYRTKSARWPSQPGPYLYVSGNKDINTPSQLRFIPYD
jgi:hypothetical protein